MRLQRLLPLLWLLAPAACLQAAEVAVLDNGARLPAERVERDGARMILHTSGGGRIEFDAARVVAVESTPDAEAVTAPAALPEAAPEEHAPVDGTQVRALVTEAALRYGLPPELVHGVAQAESAYHPEAVSNKGALGVMQLMPGTARRFSADATDVRQNIDAGVRLLRTLLERYQDEANPVRRALAAYNAGEGAVDRYHGVPPYRETEGYVERVLTLYWKNVRAASTSGN
jgi:soluble lytic murein transglycosylase-like protein